MSDDTQAPPAKRTGRPPKPVPQFDEHHLTGQFFLGRNDNGIVIIYRKQQDGVQVVEPVTTERLAEIIVAVASAPDEWKKEHGDDVMKTIVEIMDGEYSPVAPPEKVIVEIPSEVSVDKILIDRKMFHQMMFALITSRPDNYLGHGGVTRLGLMAGHQTREAQVEFWRSVQSQSL